MVLQLLDDSVLLLVDNFLDLVLANVQILVHFLVRLLHPSLHKRFNRFDASCYRLHVSFCILNLAQSNLPLLFNFGNEGFATLHASQLFLSFLLLSFFLLFDPPQLTPCLVRFIFHGIQFP